MGTLVVWEQSGFLFSLSLAYRTAVHTYSASLAFARRDYTLKLALSIKGNPRCLLKLSSQLSVPLAPQLNFFLSSREFSNDFVTKIDAIRASWLRHPPQFLPTLNFFSLTTTDEITSLISSFENNSTLDSFPSCLIPALLSSLTLWVFLIPLSPELSQLSQVCFSSSFVKKPKHTPNDPARYWSISLRPFSKRLECLIVSGL